MMALKQKARGQAAFVPRTSFSLVAVDLLGPETMRVPERCKYW